MNVRVTVSRVIRQYAEIAVSGVEGTEEAIRHVRANLPIPVRRARLLKDVVWYGDTLLSDPEEVLDATKE